MNDRIANFQNLLKQFPDNEMARFSLGKAYFDANQFAEAKSELEKALAKRPDWMVVQILIGKCQLSLGNKEGALESFKKARQLAIDQNHEGPLAEMNDLLADLGVN